ncbi:MAG: roadblock/LC7 domain-containing protein [Nitrospirae bacterium]|nr:roadblock/LC7 domain-containing protein [Nitrospirota bacterium]
MSFSDILQRIVDEEKDALGIAVVGTDGIVVEERLVAEQIDIASLSAEYSSLLKDIDRISDSLKFGSVKEIVVFTDRAIVLIKGINKEYFVLFAIRPDGNIGKGRFLLRRELPRLEKEL